ncbi:hypothetical protein AB4Z00_20320, partial [Novosphingobium sp. YAF33]
SHTTGSIQTPGKPCSKLATSSPLLDHRKDIGKPDGVAPPPRGRFLPLTTWANEKEIYNSDWIEMALAHSEDDDIRGAYNSALYLTPRRRMLQDWADTIGRSGDAAIEKRASAYDKVETDAAAEPEEGNVIRFPSKL